MISTRKAVISFFFSLLETSAGPSVISRWGWLWPLGTTSGCPGCRGSILMRLSQVLARTSPHMNFKKVKAYRKNEDKGSLQSVEDVMWNCIWHERYTYLEMKWCNGIQNMQSCHYSFRRKPVLLEMFNAVRGVSVAKLNSSPSFTLAGYDFT